MLFDLQPGLTGHLVLLSPLQPADFDAIYAVASDPLVWEQHPNRDRYKREVFQTFFEGALASGGALTARDRETGAVIGSSRFYDHDPSTSTVLIGYTFIGRNYWGRGYNQEMKQLMLEHAFRFCDRVLFHIGATNLRSQIAIGRIGARKVDEIDVAYYGETATRNFIFQVDKKDR